MLKGKGIISDFQQDILRGFSQIPDSQQFYLTGGTALAEFYFGHRLSYDLDLFTSERGLVLPFSRIVESDLHNNLPDKAAVSVIRRFESFVEFEVATIEESIRLQLAYNSPFRFDQPVQSEYGVFVNDFRDITVDKFLAYFGRSEARDAIDLFYILQQIDFGELIELASKKDPGFDLYWMAVALEKVKMFPDDIKRWPVSMISEIDIHDLKSLFSKLSQELLQKIRKI